MEEATDQGRIPEDIAVLAPNALNLTPVQLVCIHREFEKLGFDAQRLGRTDDRIRPVVTLKEGDSTYYFIKTPDGSVLQIVPARPGGGALFEQHRRYESFESYLQENPSASAYKYDVCGRAEGESEGGWDAPRCAFAQVP